MTIEELIDVLISKRLSLCFLTIDFIPKETGLYAWFPKHTNEIIYVGIAAGKGGLYRRIVAQHLNCKYLEARTQKFTNKDDYQLSHPIYLSGKVAIDKSAFRKNVAREQKLRAGEESVNYILRNFDLAYISDQDTSQIKNWETDIIKEKSPKYNIRGK